MSLIARVLVFTSAWLAGISFGHAQLSGAAVPLELNGQAARIQTPAYSSFSDPQCDSDGAVYLRHENADENSWEIARVQPDGTAQTVTLAGVPGIGDMHTFTLGIAGGGAVHEIVRAWKDGREGDAPLVYYLRFDPDGAFRSSQVLKRELIPALLLPLPNGDFFSAGVLEKKQPGTEEIEEVPVAGIFDPQARFKTSLGQSKNARLSRVSSLDEADDPEGDAISLQQGSFVRLGDDGDLYVLFTGGKARVKAYRQTGELLYELKLQQPFQEGMATGIWVSGGRLLVTYEGEADTPKDAVTYVLYDARTGEVIRAYRPEFGGAVACFQGGQSLTVLMPEKYSGTFTIGTAELQ
jgi:hypothetical protein